LEDNKTKKKKKQIEKDILTGCRGKGSWCRQKWYDSIKLQH
jgi:hypothetical protein